MTAEERQAAIDQAVRRIVPPYAARAVLNLLKSGLASEMCQAREIRRTIGAEFNKILEGK